MWGDTFWISVVDPEVNVPGVSHCHMTEKGYARLSASFIIDGEHQWDGNKVPFDPGACDIMSFSGGFSSYEVVAVRRDADLAGQPTVRVRVGLHGAVPSRRGFEGFNYDNFESRPDEEHGLDGWRPRWSLGAGMAVRGTVDLRRGPAKDETRHIDDTVFPTAAGFVSDKLGRSGEVGQDDTGRG